MTLYENDIISRFSYECCDIQLAERVMPYLITDANKPDTPFIKGCWYVYIGDAQRLVDDRMNWHVYDTYARLPVFMI